MKRLLFLLILLPSILYAQQRPDDATQLFYKMRDKIGVVKDYVADVRLKIDVAFMKVPLLAGKLYYKSPGKMKLERNGGISILPRKSISLTLDNLIPGGRVNVIDGGWDTVSGHRVHVIKVIPDGESDIILTKIWVDEPRLLALRTETTTRDNGTIRTDLEYGNYAALSLPDKVTFVLDIKDYKLPKGVTMDYDEGQDAAPQNPKIPKALKKGRIEIRYLRYQVNVGVNDAVFKE